MGVGLLPEPSDPVLVGGGVELWPATAVSPWNDWNGVLGGVRIGVAVSPWNDWKGVAVGADVSVGLCVGGTVTAAVGVAVTGSVGGAVCGSVGVAVAPWNVWNGDGVEQAPPVQAAELLLLWSEDQRTYRVVTDAGVDSELAPACIVTLVALVNAELFAHWMP